MHHQPDDPFDRREFFAPPPPPRPAYPLVFRVSPDWKIALIALGLLVVALAVLGMAYFGHIHQIRGETGRSIFIGLDAGFFLLGVYCIAAALLTRITLYADALEYRQPLSSLRVARSEIAGYRFRTTGGVTYLELLLSHGGEIHRVALLFEHDRPFAAWLEGLADADEAQLRASYEEVAADTTLGDTPEERLARTRRARRWTGVVHIIGYLLAFAAPFSSHPLLIAALLALPWLAIGLGSRFGAAVSVGEGETTSVRGDLIKALPMPAIGLAIIALKISNLEDWPKIATYASVAAVVMLALLASSAPRMSHRPARLALISVFFAVYAASTLAIANAHFDNTPPNDIVLNVTGKFSKDTRSGTHYYLLVLPWGTTKPAQEVNVNAEFYEFIQRGQEVCIHNHTGRFGLPWYEVAEAADCKRPFGGPG